jgi:hypothetical protein
MKNKENETSGENSIGKKAYNSEDVEDEMKINEFWLVQMACCHCHNIKSVRLS